MMTLPKQLQQSLRTKIKNYEEEKKMPLVSNFEKLAKEEGIQQERLGLILRQLTRKLGQVPPDLELRIKSLSLDILENLAEDLLDFNSTQDLVFWLNNHS